MYSKKYLLIVAETILFMSIIGIAIYIIFRNKSVALGLIIGAVARVTGFCTIVISSRKMIFTNYAYSTAFSQYLLRLVFYGIIISLSILKGINIVALIIGFTFLNLVILLNEKEKKIGGLKCNDREV